MDDLSVYVTSNLTSSERRISPQWDLDYFKTKLELITGIPPQFQTIQYFPISHSNEYKVISDAKAYQQDQDKTHRLTEFDIVSFSRIHVVDTNPDSELNDLDMIDADDETSENVAFKLSDEDYAKRSDSVLNWKQQNKLGRFDPEFNKIKEQQVQENEEISQTLKVGDRCRTINIAGERRGVIRYVGKINVLDKGESVWVGIEFDEPVGKNNGSIDGVKVFECKQGHGSFVKPKQVEVGDFPELDPFGSDDEDDDEL
ncbi:CAP Gly-rich domain-containing protein [Scheffersomyces coipomensis]|uniref:CAP Gly-rich domain-containing protein n=1 Tax=Scheffersomyces coipomensis TaxID=1788519 RepID=UPI00315CE09A